MDSKDKVVFDGLYNATKGAILEYFSLKADEYISEYKKLDKIDENKHENMLKVFDNTSSDIKNNEVLMSHIYKAGKYFLGLGRSNKSGNPVTNNINYDEFLRLLFSYDPFLESLNKIKNDYIIEVNNIFNQKNNKDDEKPEEKSKPRGRGRPSKK